MAAGPTWAPATSIISMRYNRELGVAVGAGPVLKALEECLFLPDFRREWS